MRKGSLVLRDMHDQCSVVYVNGEKVRLIFRIDKEAGFHITESPLSKDQNVVEHEDCYEISATVVDSAMLEWCRRS